VALHLPVAKKRALSIEIGMQNSGLASSLANSAFSTLGMAAVPGAIFSVWHNISGAILASFFRKADGI
ncbi:MAG: bile acid:sodium symporter family protein, partial [Clostridia bacterium]|nr:bile acid:sodium symporter family protein [Clostridia bacterium]